MTYIELEKLKDSWDGKVCIFGAGTIGCTWGYDIIKAAGFNVDFYCDNFKKQEEEIRDNIGIVSPKTLYEYKNNVLVFITTGKKASLTIKKQLENNGIRNTICMDYLFLQNIAQSVVETNDVRLYEKYKNIIDDKEYINRLYFYNFNYHIDWNNIRTFNEKIQWLKIYDHNPKYIQLSDKVGVKEFINEMIGEGHTVPTLYIWDNVDEIDVHKLPNQFVLKCTHDSGSIIICKDKDKFDLEKTKKFLEEKLAINYYWSGREWPYKYVIPKIIAEEYLDDGSGEGLRDYKMFCFNGHPMYVWIDIDRYGNHRRNIYDINWNLTSLSILYPTAHDVLVEKPVCFSEMVEMAKILAENIPQVRIDFYIVNGKPLVGEMTFFQGCGLRKLNPREWDYKWGDLIQLPEKTY